MNEYNGWTNYATWNVNLWLTNDEGSYNYWMERARDSEVNELAIALENEHREAMPELNASTYSDLLQYILSSVNWHEIAKSLTEEANN